MVAEPHFGRLVRERRRALDLTQDELARRVACAPITVRKIEYGALRPSRQIAERLAAALALPLEERSAFVRQARSVIPEGKNPPTPPKTSLLAPEEIGAPDLSGRAIRGYQLGVRLGEGGFGAVYRAVQPLVEREVAVKIILPQYADHPDFIRRFEAEAQMVARLEHPHIVPLYDYWREPGVAYLVMRYLRGGSLLGLLQQGPPPLPVTLRLVEQVGMALATAHHAAIVHRDLKPANILLDDTGNAYLADFGIAKNLAHPPADASFAGAYLGSPAYSAPEQIRAEPVTPQTDIYALGVLLYELLIGQRPFAGPTPAAYIQQHLSATVPHLDRHRPDLPNALDHVIQRATAKVPAARFTCVEEVIAALQAAITVGAPPTARVLSPPAPAAPPTVVLDLTDADNPYQGLRPFSEANAPRFFGRESLIQELLSQLGETGDLARFLAVIGPSGSGKSSVVRAGLVPALRTGGLPGSEQWFIVDLQPGSQPIAALAEALRRVAPAGVETEDLTALLGADNQGLLRAARLVLPADPASELLLVIDQFEELFTLTADEGVRTHLLDSLVAAVLDERSRLRVVVTLRADMLDRPLRYVDVGELFHQRAALVRPLTPDELEQAIIGPARRAGLTLEEGLEATLLEAVTAQPGALPLLQHALSELFLRRQGRLLTLAAYHAIGGVAGSLAQSAETIYAGLDAPGQAMARQMLLRLTTPGEGSDDTRRRVRRSEVLLRDSGAEQALAAFGTGRLLTFDHDPATREPTVEVAHEALLRAWPRLRGWLEAGRTDLLVQRRLAAAAHEWHQIQRDPSFLATGARLTQFAALTTATDLTLNDEETTYIHDSLAAHDQQVSAESARQERELTLQKRAASRLRYLVGALAIFLVVALGLSAFAFNRQAAADANAAQAAANLTRSEAQRLAAEANLIFQRGGDPERVTLLSIRAIQVADTPQADAALALATHATFARRVLLGHTGGVTSVAFAPDGRTMLTGSADKTARLWDVQSGQTIQTFVGHADGVTSVAFAPDGRTMLTGSADKTARLWDVQSGQTIQTFVGHADGVTSVAFAPDGRTMLTGSADKTARLWDVQSGQTIQTFIGHTDGIMSVALSPDGTQVLTGSGKLLPGSNDKTARLWDSKTGRQLQIFIGHTDGIVHVAFAPDGRRVVTSSNDKTARLWDTQTGQQVSQFDQTDAVWVAAFAADGRTILTGGDDKTARIWDVQTGKERQRAVQSGNVHAGTFAPDGRSFMIGSTDGSVRIVDVPPPTDTRLLRGHTNWVSGVRFAPDGRTLASISFDTTARLWDAQTGQELRQFVGHTDLSFGAIAFSPDGRMLATGSQDKTIRLWDVQTGQELRQITGHTDGVTQVAFSPDGQHLASSSLDKTAREWDVQTGRELLVLRGHSDGLLGVAFAPDGKTIATGSIDTTARLWDATTGALRQTLTGHTDVVNIAFSPDGEVLATASWDTTTRLWDAHTGALLHILKGHTDGVNIVAFSPDGRTVLTGSADRTARLWDRTTGAQLRVLAGHTDWVTDVAFTPDGRRIATASQDNSIRLWDTDVHDTIRWLCGRVQRDMSADERAQYGIADTESTCPGQ